MSQCPECGAAAKHLAIHVPWPGVKAPVEVLHECRCGHRFTEPVHDYSTVSNKIAQTMSDVAKYAVTRWNCRTCHENPCHCTMQGTKPDPWLEIVSWQPPPEENT